MAEREEGTRVAVHAGVSREGQEQEQKRTIRSRVAFAKLYCRPREQKVVGFHLDKGVSGGTPIEERPEGREPLRDSRHGSLDRVLAHRLGRFARSTRDPLEVRGELRKLKLAFVSTAEPFDENGWLIDSSYPRE